MPILMGEASYIWLYSSYTHPFTERNEEIFTISQNCLPLAKRKIPQQRTYLYWSRLGNVGNCVMYYCSTAYRTPYRLFNLLSNVPIFVRMPFYENVYPFFRLHRKYLQPCTCSTQPGPPRPSMYFVNS